MKHFLMKKQAESYPPKLQYMSPVLKPENHTYKWEKMLTLIHERVIMM